MLRKAIVRQFIVEITHGEEISYYAIQTPQYILYLSPSTSFPLVDHLKLTVQSL